MINNQDSNTYLKNFNNKLVTICFRDQCIEMMYMYDKLTIDQDEFYIFMGEYNKEDYDIRIVKSKIDNMKIDNDALLIKLMNGNELIIVCENGLENDYEDDPAV